MSTLTDKLQVLVYLDAAIALLQKRRHAVQMEIETAGQSTEAAVQGGTVITKVSKPRFVRRWSDEHKATFADRCPASILPKFRKVSLDISGKTVEQVQKSADPDIVSDLPAFNALVEDIYGQMQAEFDATAEDVVKIEVKLDDRFLAEMDSEFMPDVLDLMGIADQVPQAVANVEQATRMIEPERQPQLAGVAALPD